MDLDTPPYTVLQGPLMAAAILLARDPFVWLFLTAHDWAASRGLLAALQ